MNIIEGNINQNLKLFKRANIKSCLINIIGINQFLNLSNNNSYNYKKIITKACIGFK